MINKDFFAALADLEREKGISEETFLEALETALVSAYKKQYVGEAGKVEVKLDPEKGTIRCFLTRTVSDAEELGEGEISLEEAQEIKKNAKVGDVFRDEFAPKDFSRIAAQTAKQVILQKIHETERDHTLSEFSDKEGELMSGLIRKVDARNVYIELGKGQIEGLMLPQDQVPGERYNVGDKIKVYVKRIKSGGRNAQGLGTPAAPGVGAFTGASAVSPPAGMLAAWVVSKRTSPAVMHTVPAGISRDDWDTSPAVKRTVPSAGTASFRSSPRSWACRSRYSPWAVWGKHCRFTQSHWT